MPRDAVMNVFISVTFIKLGDVAQRLSRTPQRGRQWAKPTASVASALRAKPLTARTVCDAESWQP